jgi:hypothetical protein
VSSDKSSDDFLLCDEDCEIVKTRQISDNVLDIVNHKLYIYNIKTAFILQSVQRTKTYITVYCQNFNHTLSDYRSSSHLHS